MTSTQDRTPAGTRARLLLAAMFAITGLAHVVLPEPFERTIPRWVPGSPRLLNQVATAAELGSATLLSTRRTARAGGLLAVATLAGVWVANIHVALQGGYRALPGWLGGPVAAWVRVPLQLPLLWWAARVTRRADVDRRPHRPLEDQR